MKPEINCYITNNYYELLSIANKFTKNKDWAQELLHEVLLQILDRIPPLEIDNNNLKYYIIRALTVNWCSPSSPFHRKIKSFGLNSIDLKECMEVVYETYDEKQDLLLQIIEEEYGDLDWYNKIIFSKYLMSGTYQSTSNISNLSRSGVADNVTKTKNKLKHTVLTKFNKNV